MAEGKINVLVVSPGGNAVGDAVARCADPDRITVRSCATKSDALREMMGGRIHAMLVSGDLDGGGVHRFVGDVRELPVGRVLPLYVFDGEAPPEADGALVFEAGRPTPGQAADCVSRMVRRVEEVYHPVTRLMCGSAFAKVFQDALHDVKKSSVVLMVKLFGLKTFNLHKSYDDGDTLLARFGEMLCDVLANNGTEFDFAGHLSSDEFIVFSTEKKSDTLCKTIISRSDRLLRTVYTPYELMRGYVTIEDSKSRGNFYLAEAMVAGADLPVHWNSHYVYVVDMLKDLMKKVELEDLGYKILKV